MKLLPKKEQTKTTVKKQQKDKNVEFKERTTLLIRPNGRSSDYVAPSFGFGCLYNCTYCYMKRRKNTGVAVATNMLNILDEINKHSYFYADVQKPNQTDEKFITYDIGCNEDFGLHHKYHNWRYIFDFFATHEKAKATFATKAIPLEFLKFNPKEKVRIRFSIMPENLSKIVEPNTTSIIERLKHINMFVEAGYDVHINFSPVILYNNWLTDYERLFEMVDAFVKYKDKVKAEVIFLTHNEEKHNYNITNNLKGEYLLWQPHLQETKKSEYGGINLRYNSDLKKEAIHKFKTLHSKMIDWNTIRYIF